MARYRTKVVEVEAVQFDWSRLQVNWPEGVKATMLGPVLDGKYQVSNGDWIVTRPDGTRVVMKTSELERDYEKMEG